MAEKTFYGVDITLTSSWEVYVSPNPPHGYLATSASYDYGYVDIDYSEIPKGSTIHSATLYGTGFSGSTHTLSVDGGSNLPYDGGAINYTTTASARVANSSASQTVSLYYRYKAYTSTSSLGYQSSSVTVGGSLKIVYTLPYTACTAPTSLGFSKNDVGPGGVSRLSWSGMAAGTNNAIKEYKVFRSTTAAGTFTHLGTTSNAYMDVTAPTTNNGTYYYKVQTIGTVSGYDSTQSAASGALKCVFSAPSVSNVKVGGNASAFYIASGSKLNLTWDASNGTNNAITSYTIYKDGTAIKSGVTAKSYEVTISTNTSCYFSVVAVAPNGNSSSVNSPTVYGFNAVGVVGSFAASNTSPDAGTTVRLSWTAPTAVNYNEVTGFAVYRSADNSTYAHLSSTAKDRLYLDVTAHATMDKPYYYKIITTGSRQNSGYSSVVTVKSKLYSAPSVPAGVAINTPTANLAPGTSRNLTWNASSNGTNNAVASYEIHRSTDGTNYSRVATIAANATRSYGIASPATSGTTHYYKIRAMGTNTSFNSGFSSVVTISTSFSAPTVSNLKAGGSTAAFYTLKDTDVVLTWDASNGTNNAISKYLIHNGSTLVGETTSKSYTVKSHATESSSVTYSVTAVGAHSNSSKTNFPAIHSYSNTTPPTSVTLGGNNVGPGKTVALNWSGAGGGGTNNTIAGFIIYRSTSGSSGYVELAQVAANVSTLNVTSHTSNNTTYYYKVETKGSRKNSGMSSATAALKTTFSAPTVSNVRLSGSASAVFVLSSESVTLTWDSANGTNNSITRYRIYRNGAAWNETTAKSYNVSPHATAGQSYYYTVTPVGEHLDGTGVDSPNLHTTTLPVLPTSFSASHNFPDANTQFSLNWSGASAGTLNNIVRYDIYRSTSSDSGYTKLTDTTGNSVNITSHPSMGGAYYYRIVVVGEHQSSPMSSFITVISQTYSIPTAVTNITLSKYFTQVPDESVTITFSGANPGTNNPITGYDIYMSEDGTVFNLLKNVSSSPTSVRSSLTYGGKRYYKIKTKGTKEGFIESDFSETVEIETSYYTDCIPPSNLKLNNGTADLTVEETASTFSWNVGENGVNNPLTGYEIQEAIYINTTNAVHVNWRNATDLEGNPVYATSNNSISVYPPEMGYYKKFRVKTKGTQSGFDSAYVTLEPKLFRKIYTHCTAPTFSGVPNVAEKNFLLIWGNAKSGINNNIKSYEIHSSTSPNGSTWSEWTLHTDFITTETGGSLSVPVPEERGTFIMYRIKTKGEAVPKWDSPFVGTTPVKSNLVPIVPTFNFPKDGKNIYGDKMYIGVDLIADPEGQNQKIDYEIVKNDEVIQTGQSPLYTSAGSKVYPIDLPEMEPVTTEETGETVVFDDLKDGEKINIRVSGTPAQEGTGDPSPENIRPITPWLSNGASVSIVQTDGATITLTATQEIPAGWMDNEGNGQVTWAKKVFDGTESWVLGTTASGGSGEMKNTLSGLPIAIPANSSTILQGICTHYKSVTANNTHIRNIGISADSSGRIIIYDPSYNTTDVLPWKNYLAAQYAAGTPVTIVYQLATPIDITPAIAPLTAIEGTNVISSLHSFTASYTRNDFTLKARILDSLGGDSAYTETLLNRKFMTWRGEIETGMLIADHIADIEELFEKANDVIIAYGLAPISPATEIGYFANWNAQMTQLRNAVDALYAKLGVNPPRWITQNISYPNAAIFNQIRTALENIQ